MRLYRFGKLGSLDALKLREAEVPQPGAGQVAVRIRACSLNHRDLNIVFGGYTSHALKPGAIPLSDGAGEVTAVGAGVTRWKAGDRVAPIFVQRCHECHGPNKVKGGLRLDHRMMQAIVGKLKYGSKMRLRLTPLATPAWWQFWRRGTETPFLSDEMPGPFAPPLDEGSLLATLAGPTLTGRRRKGRSCSTSAPSGPTNAVLDGTRQPPVVAMVK
jgi:hypothetical protein